LISMKRHCPAPSLALLSAGLDDSAFLAAQHLLKVLGSKLPRAVGLGAGALARIAQFNFQRPSGSRPAPPGNTPPTAETVGENCKRTTSNYFCFPAGRDEYSDRPIPRQQTF